MALAKLKAALRAKAERAVIKMVAILIDYSDIPR
jgi:hypothetical protein